MAEGLQCCRNSMVLLPGPEDLSEDPWCGDWSDLPQARKGTSLTDGVWKDQKALPSILSEGVDCKEILQVGKVESREGRETSEGIQILRCREGGLGTFYPSFPLFPQG